MDPLRHLSLVRELGIDWYIPRTSLSIAAMSVENLAIAPKNTPQSDAKLVSLASPSIANPTVKRSKPDIDFGLDTAKKLIKNEQAVAATPAPRIATVKIASFNLLVASTGSLVFVTDVKTNPLTAVWERSVRQFFDEIDLACSSNNIKVQALDYFSWPIAGSGSMSLGEDQLIQLLTGFMRQRIIGDKSGVILFGDNAKRYGASVVSSMNSLKVITVPSLGVMFTNTAAKAALWRDLEALIEGRG